MLIAVIQLYSMLFLYYAFKAWQPPWTSLFLCVSLLFALMFSFCKSRNRAFVIEKKLSQKWSDLDFDTYRIRNEGKS